MTKKYLFKYFWDKQHKYQWIIFSLLLILLLLTVNHNGTIVKNIFDPATEDHIKSLQNEISTLSSQIEEKQQEYTEKKKGYDQVYNQVLPLTMASDVANQIIDKLVLTIAHDITLTSVIYLDNAIQNKENYAVYPVEATFHISKDSLSKLLVLLSQAGAMDTKKNNVLLPSGDTMTLPLITLEKIFIKGDMGDQYDEGGAKINNLVTAKLLLHFYSQT
jgi:hypothetical protein